jgi:predicted transcriptional regulator
VGKRRYEQLADRAWLRRRYIEQAIPVTAIAAEVGCSEATARHALAAAGIARQPRGAQRIYHALTDETWLRRRYVEEAASAADIAAQIGCSEHTVRRALTAAGIWLQGRSRSHRRYPQLGDRTWLWQRHVDQGVSAAGIAAELGCNETTVRNALRAAAIPLVDHRRRHPQLADTASLRDSSTPTR